jgi:C-terminal processing protease CtpA/Prc
MSKKRAALVALIASILIHLSLTYFLKLGGEEGGEGQKKSEPVKIKLLDKPSNTESKTPEKKLPENKSEVVVPKEKELPPEQKVVEHKCEEFYEGIGIQFNNVTPEGCFVSYVGKGYPAHRAGIAPGDMIVDEGARHQLECPGRGPIGSMLDLEVVRNGQTRKITVVREKICISPEEKP